MLIPIYPRASALLISALPSTVRSQISKVPIIRRALLAAHLVDDRETPYFSDSHNHPNTSIYQSANQSTRPNTSTSTDTSTSTTSSSGTATPRGQNEPEMFARTVTAISSGEESRPSTAGSSSVDVVNGLEMTMAMATEVKPMARMAVEEQTGIRWNRAMAGLHILRTSTYESQQVDADPALARSLFIDGTAYLLDSLPQNLTPDEARKLRQRLPPDLLSSSPNDPHSHSNGMGSPSSKSTPTEPTLLHRTLSTTILLTCILLSLLLPYLKSLLRALHQIEREHRLSERLLLSTCVVVESAGRSGADVGRKFVRASGEGRWGLYVRMWAEWVGREVVGGVWEGVERGVGVLGGEGRDDSIVVRREELDRMR